MRSRFKNDVAEFATEAELCRAFISQIPDGWVAYPETHFDILLHRVSDGVQIGIEAKLTLNSKVIEQIFPSDYWSFAVAGPDYRAVLVPWGRAGGLKAVCKLLSVTVIEMASKELYQSWDSWRRGDNGKYRPPLPNQPDKSYRHRTDWRDERNWYDWAPPKPLKLPDYIPDVTAGASAPSTLSEWKIKAIKISIVLERRGYVVKSDFKALQIDPSRWFQGWLAKGELRGQYVRGKYTPDFRIQHAVNYAQIEADYEKWSASLADIDKDLL